MNQRAPYHQQAQVAQRKDDRAGLMQGAHHRGAVAGQIPQRYHDAARILRVEA